MLPSVAQLDSSLRGIGWPDAGLSLVGLAVRPVRTIGTAHGVSRRYIVVTRLATSFAADRHPDDQGQRELRLLLAVLTA